jgi:hypothetical protein
MMTLTRLLSIILLALCAFTAKAAPLTYDVFRSLSPQPYSFGGFSAAGSLIGTITTDGTIGQLQSSNIIDFSLLLSVPSAPDVTMTPINSTFAIQTTAIGLPSFLSATASNIYFDTSPLLFISSGGTPQQGSGYAQFLYQSSLLNAPNFGWSLGTGFVGSASFGDESLSAPIGLLSNGGISYEVAFNTKLPIGLNSIATIHSVPVSAAWLLMLVGLVMMGLRSNKNKA